MLATKDNWKDTQQAEITATTIPPINDRESAILVTLDPGAYTAILAGKKGGTGVGLVEIYDLDQTASVETGEYQHPRFCEYRLRRHDRRIYPRK